MSIRTPADFGFAIREARGKANLSQQGLAAKIGTTQARISRLEKGDGAVNLRTILQLLLALNLQIQISSYAQEITEADEDDSEQYEVDLDAIANTGLRTSRSSAK